jgi:hypothetical protein
MNLDEIKQKPFSDITREELLFLVENVSFEDLEGVFREAHKRNATKLFGEEYHVSPAPDFKVTKIEKNIK